ncbi:MAG TPA: C25 family cysteine peptidase, partial [Candidatus Eisenbacteria bacterium]
MSKLLRVVTLSAAVFAPLSLAVPAHAATVPPHSGSVIEREFRYGPESVRTVVHAGLTLVEAPRGVPEERPGLPDLPALSETVEVPAGMQAVGVDVLEMETVPLAEHADLPSSPKISPEALPDERTPRDARAFARAGFQPEVPVRVGYQGTMREHNLVMLEVRPARWDASTGRLERVSRLRVRLRLEPGGPVPLERQRIVPEWEGGARTAAPARAGAAGPAAGAAQPFRPTQVPSLLGSPVAYVIVTNDEMAPVFQQLADWKTQSGQPAVVRTMSFIRQQYAFGSDDAERVRLFLRDCYQRWGTQYVLLAGDTDVIPTRLAHTIYYGGEDIASDLYFSCLDGNWNANGNSLYGEGYYSVANPGDNADLLPEVWVGRLPATTPAQAQLLVNKTLQYIRSPVSDYMTRFLFFAMVLFPQPWSPGMVTSLDGAELVDYDVLPILDTAPQIGYARLYQNYTDSRWRPGSLPETRAVVIDSLNRGYNIAVHVGHGYRTVMSCGDDNLTSNDAFALTNGNRLINMYAIDCTSNAIDFPCIGESFLLAPNGGAVTNIGSTRFDFPTTGRAYQQEYFRLLFQDNVTTIGEAQGKQKLPFLSQSSYDG